MIWSIAWKNVLRNKLRSSVVMAAVTIGILAGAFTVAVITGMAEDRTNALIANESSHIQIHHSKFTANHEPEYRIKKTEKIEKALKTQESFKNLTKRTVINAMASSSSGSNAAVFINGINPEQEKQVTDIHKHLNDTAGSYFDVSFSNPAVIGEALAENLKMNRFRFSEGSYQFLKQKEIPDDIISKLKSLEDVNFRRYYNFKDSIKSLIGEEAFEQNEYFIKESAEYFRQNGKVIFTFMDKEGHQTGAVFRICGIYKTDNTGFDAMNVFVRNKDLERLSGYTLNQPHEIAVLLDDKSKSKALTEDLQKQFPELSVRSWQKINPEVGFLSEYLDFYNYFIVGLILAALAFGIINTMLMAIMERTKELGMLAAVGMNKKRRFFMIMLETIFLTLVGAVIGIGLNALILTQLSETGIDFSKQMAEGMESLGYSAVMYPKIYPAQYIGIIILVILTAILSSIYPAVKALRLNPADAIRSDA
jgi:ABC-type lipoprotein release transport system permease subunit